MQQESELIGISLVDTFAMAALPFIVRNNDEGELNYKEAAEQAYKYAEAMMSERLKRTSSRYGKKKDKA